MKILCRVKYDPRKKQLHFGIFAYYSVRIVYSFVYWYQNDSTVSLLDIYNNVCNNKYKYITFSSFI